MPGERSPLDNAVWAALTSCHAGLAEGEARARRYPADVSPFVAVDELDAESLRDLASLTGGSPVALFRAEIPTLPEPWTELRRGRGHQYVLPTEHLVDGEPVAARRLTETDVPRMLELAALARPGPFLPRTIELGRYVGHVEGGRLLAMAGERLHLDGFTEISAVCTHPSVRGRGIASALTRHVARGILDRGEVPFLHVAGENDAARRVYEALGFVRRRTVEFAVVAASPV